MDLRARYTELPYREALGMFLPDSILPRREDVLMLAARSCGFSTIGELAEAGAEDPEGLAHVASLVGERSVALAALRLVLSRGHEVLPPTQEALALLHAEMTELQELGILSEEG